MVKDSHQRWQINYIKYKKKKAYHTVPKYMICNFYKTSLYKLPIWEKGWISGYLLLYMKENGDILAELI